MFFTQTSVKLLKKKENYVQENLFKSTIFKLIKNVYVVNLLRSYLLIKKKAAQFLAIKNVISSLINFNLNETKHTFVPIIYF